MNKRPTAIPTDVSAEVVFKARGAFEIIGGGEAEARRALFPGKDRAYIVRRNIIATDDGEVWGYICETPRAGETVFIGNFTSGTTWTDGSKKVQCWRPSSNVKPARFVRQGVTTPIIAAGIPSHEEYEVL